MSISAATKQAICGSDWILAIARRMSPWDSGDRSERWSLVLNSDSRCLIRYVIAGEFRTDGMVLKAYLLDSRLLQDGRNGDIHGLAGVEWIWWELVRHQQDHVRVVLTCHRQRRAKFRLRQSPPKPVALRLRVRLPRGLVTMDQNPEYSEWESAQPTFVRTRSACEVAMRCWKLSHEFLDVSHGPRNEESKEQFSTRWAQTVVGRLPKRDSLAHEGFRSCT